MVIPSFLVYLLVRVMSSVESRPANSFGIWLIVSVVAVLGVAQFSAIREKPPVIFAAGFGLVAGLLLRTLAGLLSVKLTRWVTICAVLLAALGFAASFSVGYLSMSVQWKQLHPAGSENPLAATLLKSFPDSDPQAILAAQQRFTFLDYLSYRVPDWPSPWPEALCGAEWLLCIVIAALCVGIRQSRERERPVAHAAEKIVADASGSDEESSS